MKKIVMFIGVLFTLFSFIFIGLYSCSEDEYEDRYSDGNNTITCSTGYIPCPGTGRCCGSQYSYHGDNGKCYTTLSACQQNASECTQCGDGNSGGGTGGGNCSSGYVPCFGIDKCCPTGYPYHGNNGKCYTNLDQCRRNTTGCTQCATTGNEGTCSPGYCLISAQGIPNSCCPVDYPYKCGSKCWKSTSDALAGGYGICHRCR